MSGMERVKQTAIGAGQELGHQAVGAVQSVASSGMIPGTLAKLPDQETLKKQGQAVVDFAKHPMESSETALADFADKMFPHGGVNTPEQARQQGASGVQAAETIVPGGGAIADVARMGARPLERGLAPLAERVAQRGEAKVAERNLPNAAENERITRLKQMGYSQAPTTGGGGVLGRAGEAISGQLETEYALSRKNAKVSNRKAADDIGIAKNQPLSEQTVEAKKQEAFKVYDQVKNASKTTGRVVADDKFRQSLDAVRERTGQEAADFPEDVNEQIEKEINKFNVKDADSSSLLAKVKKLRERASKNMRGEADAFELGVAQKKIATSMEDLLDRHVESTQPGLIKDFRDARQRLAKIYNIEDALTPNGNISPAVLARQLKRNVPLTGGLKDIAEAYQMNKRAMRTVDDLGGKGEFSRLDVLVGGAEMLVHPAKAGLIAAGLGARPLARAIITSKPYQRAAIGSKAAQPGLISREARKIANSGRTLESLEPPKATEQLKAPEPKRIGREYQGLNETDGGNRFPNHPGSARASKPKPSPLALPAPGQLAQRHAVAPDVTTMSDSERRALMQRERRQGEPLTLDARPAPRADSGSGIPLYKVLTGDLKLAQESRPSKSLANRGRALAQDLEGTRGAIPTMTKAERRVIEERRRRRQMTLEQLEQ